MKKTREEWLTAAVSAMAFLIEQNGAKMPEKWAISVGFPKGAFRNNPSIGECWDPQVSPDGTTHMFISPTLDEPVRILDVVLHEMIHAAVGLECKHTGEFRRVARGVGLKGKLTATVAEEGSDLHQTLLKIADDLGKYPGSPLKPQKTKKEKKGWFLVKLMSPNDPGYRFTIAPRLLEEYGLPKDFMGDDMMVVPVDAW